MEKYDSNFMKEAITWADDCAPIKDSVPKVGAIIAVREKVLGRGRRGTGRDGDDEHAERNAIDDIKDKSAIAGATLYTTLEPCTKEVRSNPLESCTELIRQHQIKKVFVGILDPNQGVTGKGLWRLQESGVEVALFPHDLSQKIRAQNAAFIRAQQTLGATILSPTDGEELRTYETNGRHPIRFKCLNPPGPDVYLLQYRNGQYWPQPGPFREIEAGIWEIDSHFGSTGEHVLQLATANDLAGALIRYYRKVVEANRARRARLGSKVEPSILGSDYPGIEMNGLLKGLRLEASVRVFIAYKIELIGVSVESQKVQRGRYVRIRYEIECSENVPEGVWLGASYRHEESKAFSNISEDRAVSLSKDRNECERIFTMPNNQESGTGVILTGIWRGTAGDSAKSKRLASGHPISIQVVE